MSNELIPANVSGGALTKHSFNDAVASASSFLLRLQLFGSKSDACAEGKIGIGRYGLVGDNTLVDLGVELDLVIVSWRPKALEVGTDGIFTDHDPASEMYKSIQERSGVKDSGCMYGPEFLVWIPGQDVFATFFASSKTARREAKKTEPLIGKAATFKVHLIDSGRYKWHGPVIVPCSSPLEVPALDVIQAEVDKFQNPPKSDVEVADDQSAETDRVR